MEKNVEKDEIRRRVREKKRAMTEKEILCESACILERLLTFPQFLMAREVYLYASYNQEVKTDAIFRASRKLLKRTFYPRVSYGEMQFYEVEEREELISGYQGIPEPKKGREASLPKEGAIFLMPGLAFSKEGGRIGYGGGFYDRYFETRGNERLCKLALAYEFQIFDQLPIECHDVGVDFILTSERIL